MYGFPTDKLIDPVINNWPLIIVGAAASWAALRTLTAIRTQGEILERQTRATEIAADAAKANAEFLVNSERAWVLVESATLRIGMEPHILEVYPTIKNYGKTMARITKFSGSMVRLELEEALPSEVKYNHVQVLNYLLYPNAEFQPVAFPIHNDQWQDLATGLSMLWLFGAVEYLDLGNAHRVSRFCISYENRADSAVPLRGVFYPVIARDMLLKYTECT